MIMYRLNCFIVNFNKKEVYTMSDLSIDTLSQKIDMLIQRCQLLQDENSQLKTQLASWQSERLQLIQKSDLARTKVEAMITRLKALEQR